MSLSEKTPPAESLRLLYIDDDPDDRELFAEALSRIDSGAELVVVDSCMEGLRLLNENNGNKFDLIFLDINLPAIDGRECLKLLKADAALKSIAVVMLTNSRSDRDIDLAYSFGAHYHMIKPVAYINLIASLKLIFEINWKIEQPVPSRDKFVINYAFK
jgi:CheY-like chemotaxis protein